MTSACATPISWDDLLAYWCGDLAHDLEDRVDAHLMGCGHCTRASARIAAVAEGLRSLLPPIVTRARVDDLVRRGLRVVENVMRPGERREVAFPEDVDLLVHVLAGLELDDARDVEFFLRDELSGRVLAAVPNAPFDRAGGTVLVACQKHYAALPPDTVAEVVVRDAHGGERKVTYAILHRYGAGAD